MLVFFFFLATPRSLQDLSSLRPWIEPVPSAVKEHSPNHWTARVFP